MAAKKVQPRPLAALFGQFCLPLSLMVVVVRPLDWGWENSNLLLKLVFPTECVGAEVKSAGEKGGSTIQVPKTFCVKKSATGTRHAWKIYIDMEKHIKITKITKRTPGSHIFSMSSWV